MPKQDYLPPEAIPGLIDLMATFKKTLRIEMQSFKETHDVAELRRAITKLRTDLIFFNENFDYLHQNAETHLEYQLLDDLAKELGEAQNLLCKAVALIKPTH